MSPKTLKNICVAVGLAWFINFALFVLGTFVFGGSATLTHPPRDGHYYLSEHGHVTEVSAGIYAYSRIHRNSLWLTAPLLVIAALLAWRMDEAVKRKSG